MTVMKAAMIHPRLRCRAAGWLAVLGTNFPPRYWVIHAIPDVPPNEAAAAESATRIMPTGVEHSGHRVENAAGNVRDHSQIMRSAPPPVAFCEKRPQFT